MLDRRKPISIAEAQAKLAELTFTYKTETLPIAWANHRVLAQAVLAPDEFPNFRRSGYDGYAIRAEDDHDLPQTFKVMGEVQAGAVYKRPLGYHETVRIMTGAAVPSNAGKVIMLEQSRPVEGHPDEINLVISPDVNNITEIGVEFHQGDTLIPENTVLNPGHISLLTALNVPEVVVYQRPQVGIITTGTEVLAPGAPAEPGKIYNSNGALLQGLVQEAGGRIIAQTQIEDDYDLLLENLKTMAKDCDLILTTGGVSVGDFDFLAIAAKSSQKLLFNKLKMRPGSVTTGFIFEDTPIMALSGNPGACFTGFYLFAEPLLRKLGHEASRVQAVTATLAKPYDKTNGYDRILRGTYYQKDDHYFVELVGSDQSGALGNLGSSTCLFKIPSSNKPIPLHSEVSTWLLPYKW
ncbi:MAG: molybdopterin molybdotransferase MoeA [Lactobacillus sp.]|nr:molybdopterin molybdotransferase MoeA [Lactobacillus sp.]